MTRYSFKSVLNVAISLVWLINGLFCKLLNIVPRHQLIVTRLLGTDHAFLYTKAIGCSEVLMFVWILTGYKSRLCSITQVLVVAAMNTIEFLFAPDLLLFGQYNALVALLFISLVLLNEFALPRSGSDIHT